MTTESGIFTKDVTVTYRNGHTALRDASFEIPKSTITALVGVNGAGKSTLLRIIAGLLTPTTGAIILNGHDISHVPTHLRSVGMVFQDNQLFPHLNVYDNVAFGLRMAKGEAKLSGDEIKARVQEAAEMLDLVDHLDKKPKELSGGQRQRVALGRALVRRPKVLLMDEPLSNLDAELRHQMRSEIRKLHDELGTTTIYVTHDQIEAMTMADRIVVMHQGKIVEQGPTKGIYEKPKANYTRELLNAIPGKHFKFKVS